MWSGNKPNVVKTENSQSLLNARANLIQRATAIKIRFKILRKTNKKFQTFFTDQWADICDLLGNEANKGNVFWDMFSVFILKNTNVNHSCPYEPQEIYTKDFILCNQVGDILPFPKGFYRSELTIFANSAKRCMIRVDGEKS
ncbi:uncharacterized protein LOC106092651 [Stomoxys calcitrans]|uniref:uncharacterized protein LOC106092651 n=1 Tax=Stomoxys calcitrans TaxID=35570 RepID=UPI0027E32496|nr:uncharacterized protein LOC106092651 [Stomoxys calcitrans]